MAVQIQWLISRTQPDQREMVRAMYQENVRTLELMNFENSRSVAKTAAVMTQAQLKGILDPNMVDVSRLQMAYRVQNFFEKYDRKALDDYLTGKINYEQLKAKMERIKKTNRKYLGVNNTVGSP